MTVNMNLGDTQLLIKECARQGLSKAHTAYVLATVYWETNKTMKPVKEAYWLSETWRKNNLRYYPWYGRGYIQLTWEDNYIKAGKKLLVDLTTNPEKVMEPAISAKIAVAGMKEGWFTGKKLSDYTNPENMRPIVNGDSNKLVDGVKIKTIIANKAAEYEKALPNTKVEEGKTSGLVTFITSLLKLLFGAKK